MGKSKEMMMDFDNSEEYIDEQIHLKLSNEHQHYVNLYIEHIDNELNNGDIENKN
jgi:hypothetical protein